MSPVIIPAGRLTGSRPRHVDADYASLLETIKQLRSAGNLEAALRLASLCMDGTEEHAASGGNIAPGFFDQAAMIYRQYKRYDDEIVTVNRCLRQLETGGGWWDILTMRAQQAWEISGHAGELPPVQGRPPARPSPRPWWARDPGPLRTTFFNGREEYEYRLENLLPSIELRRNRWANRARTLLGTLAIAEPLVETLLDNADRFGVVTPNIEMVRATFSPTGPDGRQAVDLRTGELVDPAEPVEMWLAAVTVSPLPVVLHGIKKLSPSYRELIEFWQIPGDPLDARACLTLC